MMDFIRRLYDYDNFTLYLTIILVVLVILFVLVLIFGKKDQKLEETRRLQKIELEKEQESKSLFKEETKTGEKLETENKNEIIEKNSIEEKKETNEREENDKIKVSLDEEEDLFNLPLTSDFDSEAPKENNVIYNDLEVEVTVFEPPLDTPMDLPLKKEESSKNAPVLTTLDFDEIDEISNSLEKDLHELRSIKQEFNDLELPTMNDSLEKEEKKEQPEKVLEKPEMPKEETKTFKPSQVFSSVYVNKNTEENNKPPVYDNNSDDDDFELPILK